MVLEYKYLIHERGGEIDIINYKSFFINYISPLAGAQIDRLVLRNGDKLYTILELKD